MILRIKVPQPFFLYGRHEEFFSELKAAFTHHSYSVALSIEGGTLEKADHAKPENDWQWIRWSTDILITISDTASSHIRIDDLIKEPHHDALRVLFEGVALRVLRAIRNIGVEPELPEALPREESLEKDLQLWAPEVSEDGTSWKAVFSPAPRKTILSIGPARKEGFASNGELNVAYWDKIREVIEDNLEIPPEDEFFTNTIGHMRRRNYRLAVVDSVIGLEIVLSRYLHAYLSVVKRLPTNRVKEFLRHDFGLTVRLSGILDLTLHESYLKDIDIDSVLTAVKWRNGIVHRSGRLPSETPAEKISDVTRAVLTAARTLAEVTVGIGALPDRNRIGEAVEKKWSSRITAVKVWIFPWHRVTVEIDHDGTILSRNEMAAIVADLIPHFQGRDRRFDGGVHLLVRFFHGFPRKDVGQYRFGLVILDDEKIADALKAKKENSP